MRWGFLPQGRPLGAPPAGSSCIWITSKPSSDEFTSRVINAAAPIRPAKKDDEHLYRKYTLLFVMPFRVEFISLFFSHGWTTFAEEFSLSNKSCCPPSGTRKIDIIIFVMP
jgi:hypothetical protein